MKASVVERALRHVYDAREHEIPCSEFFDRISEYVDREVAGNPIAEQMPDVKYHLEHCRVCGEEYTVLRDLTRLDSKGELPSEDQIRKSL